MSNLVGVLVTCIRHPDVHNFIYNCIFARLLYIFVYIKPNKKIKIPRYIKKCTHSCHFLDCVIYVYIVYITAHFDVFLYAFQRAIGLSIINQSIHLLQSETTTLFYSNQ